MYRHLLKTAPGVWLAAGIVLCPTSPAATAATNTPAKLADRADIKQLKVDDFARLMTADNTVVLDVRTPREFSAGHIKGSININIGAGDFEQQAKALDKSKTYLVLCASGVRSQRACQKLAGMGFTKLANLSSGIMGWQSAGKPVER